MPSQHAPDIGWTRPSPAALRHHRLLFFRCAVTQANDLFRLAKPLSRKVLVRLTHLFRDMSPHVPMTSAEPVRIFSVLNRLLTTSAVLQPDFPKNHSEWMDEALKGADRTLHVDHVISTAELEEDGEFLYLPALKKCYTLTWRWLSVLSSGEEDAFLPALKTEVCNEILGIIRNDLSLQPSTYLDLYPAWVKTREAGVLLEKDHRIVQGMGPSNYCFKPWEGVPP